MPLNNAIRIVNCKVQARIRLDFSGVKRLWLKCQERIESTVYISVNDPWKPISSSGARTSEPESIDPFSPQAQSQLAEFDMLRNQIETKGLAERNVLLLTNSSNGNNAGNYLDMRPSFGHNSKDHNCQDFSLCDPLTLDFIPRLIGPSQEMRSYSEIRLFFNLKLF